MKGGGSVVLTQKQEKYVQGLVAGLSQRQAYIQAYSTKNMKDATIDNNAYKLMQNNEISTRYNELMEEHRNKALWTREQAVNDLIWLKEQAKKSIKEQDEGYIRQGTSTAYVNAIKELNALEGVYPDKTQNININGELNNPFGGLTTEQLARLADGYE
jgi:phage terminase small subunit